MSHLTDISTKHDCYNIETLKRMCQTEGWEFVENQKNYAWYGHFVGDSPMPKGFTVEELGHCDHAIKIPGCGYEVGVVMKEGKLKIIYDYYYSGGLDKALGEHGEILNDAYDVAKTTEWAEQKGYQWEEEKLSTGARKITIGVSEW